MRPGAPRLRVSAVVLDAPDPRALAGFYRALLGWAVAEDRPEWVVLRPPGGGVGVAFQAEPLFEAPSWPARGGAQQMMAHLDIEVEDLAAAGAHAQALGAVRAQYQPQERVRVWLDPVGHPFCLFLAGHGA